MQFPFGGCREALCTAKYGVLTLYDYNIVIMLHVDSLAPEKGDEIYMTSHKIKWSKGRSLLENSLSIDSFPSCRIKENKIDK